MGKGPRPKTLAGRFWPKVAVAGSDDCWLWTAATNNQGYGFLTRRADEPGSSLAHRVAWELSGGTVPEGYYLHHCCNQRLCCNPSHLQPVTPSVNGWHRWRNPTPQGPPPPKPPKPVVPRVEQICHCGKAFSVIPSRIARGFGTFCSYGCRRRGTLAERFWEKIEKSDDCWLWTGAIRTGGYGALNSGGERAPLLGAHRVSWEIHNGVIPAGLLVLHRCDVRLCVRPDHLFLGTQAENVADMHAKGRQAPTEKTRHPGESNGRAKLTEDDVRHIRQSPRLSLVDLAREYQVHPDTILRVRKGHGWKSVK